MRKFVSRAAPGQPKTAAAVVNNTDKPAASIPEVTAVPTAPAVTDGKSPTPQRPAPKPSEAVVVPTLNSYVKSHLSKAEVWFEKRPLLCNSDHNAFTQSSRGRSVDARSSTVGASVEVAVATKQLCG